MDTNPPPASGNPWKIKGTILPARIGWPYKFGAALNAIAMLLLPALYIAMVGGLGWFIYVRMSGKNFDGTESNDDPSPGYFLLLVAGTICLVFMTKPFFARRPKKAPPLELTRAEHPRICLDR